MPKHELSGPSQIRKWSTVLSKSPNSNLLQVDLNALPEPPRNFVASRFRLDLVEKGGNTFTLTFGQVLPPGRLAYVVAIHTETEGLKGLLRSIHKDFRATMDRISGSASDPARIPDSDIMGLDLGRTWAGKASMCRASISEYGAQLDWYELSPRSLVEYLRGDDPSVAPGVMTIFTSVSCLRAIVADCTQAVGLGQPEEAE